MLFVTVVGPTGRAGLGGREIVIKQEVWGQLCPVPHGTSCGEFKGFLGDQQGLDNPTPWGFWGN